MLPIKKCFGKCSIHSSGLHSFHKSSFTRVWLGRPTPIHANILCVYSQWDVLAASLRPPIHCAAMAMAVSIGTARTGTLLGNAPIYSSCLVEILSPDYVLFIWDKTQIRTEFRPVLLEILINHQRWEPREFLQVAVVFKIVFYRFYQRFFFLRITIFLQDISF